MKLYDLRILLPAALIAVLLTMPAAGQDGGMDAGPHARQSLQRPMPVLSRSAVPAGRMPGVPGGIPSRVSEPGALSRPGEFAPGVPGALPRTAERTHLIFGYHPYWIPDSVAALYRYELLSHLAYFSAEVDAVSGEIIDTHGWLTAPVVDRAKAAGAKVQLVVTNFGTGANRTLLSSPAAQDTLIRRIVALLRLRGADGVNIDFEAVPGDQRDNLTAFFAALDAALAAELPGAEISAALPAVDWNSTWDAAALAEYVDLFFLMCYDYWWSGSSTAGPVAPLQGATYNVTRSLADWALEGVPPGKTILGVPYYGYDWPVRSGTPQSLTEGTGVARVYSRVVEMLRSHDRQWSAVFLNPWFPYQVADWRQVWYDDEESLEYKYALVKDLGIAGAGIWALGYDGDLPELWDLLERMFTRPASAEDLPTAATLALEIYPQPARSGAPAFCSYRIAGGRNARLILRDLLGRVLWDAHLEGTTGRAALPARDLRPGTYVLELSSGVHRLLRPVVVLR